MAEQTSSTGDTKSWKKILFSIASWIAIVYICIAALLAFVVPDFARHMLQQQLSTEEFTTQIDKLSINPLALSVTAEGYSLRDSKQASLLQFQQLRVNITLKSLLRWALSFDEVAIVKPEVTAQLDKRQRLNWQSYSEQLLARYATAEQDPPPQQDEDEALPRLVIDKLVLDEIDLRFIDQSKRRPFEAQFGPTSIEIENLSTLLQDDGQYSISASTSRSELVAWNGEIELNPLRSSGAVALAGWRLPMLWEYFQDQLNFEIVEGTAGFNARYHFDGNLTLSEAMVKIEDLRAHSLSGDRPELIAVPLLQLTGVDFDLQRQRLDIDAIDLQDVQVTEFINTEGESLLATSFAPQPQPQPQPKANTDGSPGDASTQAVAAETVKSSEAPEVAQAVKDAPVPAAGEAVDAPAVAGATADTTADAPAAVAELEADAPADAGTAEDATVPAAEAANTTAVADTADAPVVTQPVATSGQDAAPAAGFSLGLNTLTLNNASVALRQQVSASAASEFQFHAINLSLEGFEFPQGDIQRFSLDTGINETGQLSLQGSGDIDPLQAKFDVELSDFGLVDLMPYVAPFVRIDLESGAVNAQLNADLALVDGGLRSHASGNAQVVNLLVKDPDKKAKLVSFKALNLKQINWDGEQPGLQFAEVELQQPFAKVVIFKDGSTNLSRLAVEQAPASGDTPGSPGAEPELETGDAAAAEPIAVNIKTVSLRDGTADFADLSLPRAFKAAIYSIDGGIEGLSSDADAAATVDITGAVDKYAPVTLKGKVKPLSEKLLVDLQLSFRNMELTAVSPYSDTYAGYNIDKGKLNADFKYFIDGSQLQAENNLIVDQLTLGERTDSLTATSLPVVLAVALLKDKNGVIDLSLPVSGEIDNPEFSYGALIGKALLNLITKIVTSPFAALGKLVGGGEDMDTVEFEPGQSEFSAAEASKLTQLAEALAERPQLTLSVRGMAVRATDGPALKQARLDAQLAELGVAQPIPDDGWKPVFKLYKKTTGDSVRKVVKQLMAETGVEKSGAQLESREQVIATLLAAEEVTDDDYQDLAHARAQQVRETLVGAGIEPSRVFVLDASVTDDDQEKPHCQLELEAK